MLPGAKYDEWGIIRTDEMKSIIFGFFKKLELEKRHDLIM